MSITSRQIKSLALDTGFDACGITNINISPHPNPLPKGEGKSLTFTEMTKGDCFASLAMTRGVKPYR